MCLSEDAGSGKSIATRRLEAFLCSGAADEDLFDGGPCMAVRWEPRVQRWPSRFDEEGLITALADAMKLVFEDKEQDKTIREAARWALRQQRVVLISDALDQVHDADSIASLKESLHNGPLRHAHVLITSREFALADYWPLFEETGKRRFGRIDPFDRAQQEAYLKDLYEGDFEAQYPAYETVRDLLQVPVVLAMIRELSEDARRFPEFRTRGDLYLKVEMHVMTRAAGKWGIEPDGARRLRWREILPAIACEMISRSIVNYAVQGDDAVIRAIPCIRRQN